MSYHLRVRLPDHPGSLGSLAIALGTVEADIVSLDVVERNAEFAVDDLVVEMPLGALPDTLITALERLEGVYVDSLRPYSGLLDARGELELIDRLATAPESERRELLVESLPKIFRVSWAILIGYNPKDGAFRVAASSTAPETHAGQVPWIPLAGPRRFVSTEAWVPPAWREMDTEMAAAPLVGSTAILLGRIGGPEFRPSEVGRLGHFAGIVSALRPSAGGV